MSKSIVIRHNNDFEPFQRDKLFISINDSLKHRKSSLEDATALTATIISTISSQTLIYGEVTREMIVRSSLRVLKRFDSTAYTYYKAYHPIVNS